MSRQSSDLAINCGSAADSALRICPTSYTLQKTKLPSTSNEQEAVGMSHQNDYILTFFRTLPHNIIIAKKDKYLVYERVFFNA